MTSPWLYVGFSQDRPTPSAKRRILDPYDALNTLVEPSFDEQLLSTAKRHIHAFTRERHACYLRR